MSRVLRWRTDAGRIEIRFGAAPPIERLALGTAPRPADSPLFHASARAQEAGHLPAWVLPAVDVDGRRVALEPQLSALSSGARWLPATLVLPEGHPRVAAEATFQGDVEVLPVWWLTGAEAHQVEGLCASARLLPGLHVAADGSVAGEGVGGAGLYLQRLPRVLFEDHTLIADNTDASVSMGRLLESFVQRFTSPERALPHVRVATGYLFHHGLERVLRLLENPKVKTLHLLFSGKTDARTARALTQELAQGIAEDLERAPEGVWGRYREAVEKGRFQVRVYTDAFLHAKLFLGWDFQNQFGKLEGGALAVVGSSNLSASGLRESGNLELDVTIREPDVVTRLNDWFNGRWEEASPPEPSLLELLDAHRPLPPPVFRVEGLQHVWRAGHEGRLDKPEVHLAFLAGVYAERLKGLELPTDEAYPPNPRRTLKPTLEQEEGVRALVQRLEQSRIAFLADSVGLGKTVTALGAVWYLRRHEKVKRPVLVAPRKLLPQWQDDASRLRAPDGLLHKVNRHALERMEDADARRALEGVDLLVVEEAHEALRSRGNRLWKHLRAHLKANPGCRLLLISATPWNNRREDIFNYLLLAWNEGRLLRERYPALEMEPLRHHISNFMVDVAGSLSGSAAVRAFDRLPLDTYRRIFDAVFVQRTRSSLARRYGTVLDYPERRVHPNATPASAEHDALLAELGKSLVAFNVPYREPFFAVLKAAGAAEGEEEGDESNLQRSFLIQLYKRAESSEFALAVSLATVERQLLAFDEEMQHLARQKAPRRALADWLQERYLRSEEREGGPDLLDMTEVDALGGPEMVLSPAEKARFATLRAVLERLDDAGTRRLLGKLRAEQIAPDLERVRALRARLTAELDERSPKALLLTRLTREAYVAGHKPILVAGYADTAVRTFVRLVALLPDARIGLALGGEEGWLYQPGVHRPAPLSEAEWDEVLDMTSEERRRILLAEGRRARTVARADLLNAFAPRARGASPELFTRLGGEVDILVGSEAISVGHNLQDSTCLVQLDLPWNPMVIEQRIGRVDRRGGGRPDPENPGGRRIVDVHYCWSHAAIEEEVALRRRLKEKAHQAIQDTNFDEVLLLEVMQEIERVRAERAADGGKVGQLLDARQRELAEQKAQVGGIALGGGSELDGLRQLSAWLEAQPGEVTPPPPVVAACCEGTVGAGPRWRWLLSLEVQPKAHDGTALGPPKPLQLPLEAVRAQDSEEADLEAVVSGLLRAGAHAKRQELGRAAWAEELRALDDFLLGYAVTLKDEHNARVRARLAQAAAPAANRDPSAKLRTALVEAGNALKGELLRLGALEEGKTFLAAERERLGFLMQRVLRPEAAVDLLAHQDETALVRALSFIRTFPDRFLSEDFGARFEGLCGALWEARNGSGAGASAPAELATNRAEDSLWHVLGLRLVAATFVRTDGPVEAA